MKSLLTSKEMSYCCLWILLVVSVTIKVSQQCSAGNMNTMKECIDTANTHIASQIESISGDFANSDTYCANIVVDMETAENCLSAVTSADCRTYRDGYKGVLQGKAYKILQVCECDDVGNRLLDLDDCISDIPEPSTSEYSYQRVCDFVDRYARCLVDTVEQCDAMKYITRFDDIRKATDLYDCHIKINDGYYQTQKCSYLNITKCYNPAFTQHFPSAGLFSKDLTWLDIVFPSFELLVVDITARLDCSALGSDWKDMYKCSAKEFQKCDVAWFKTFEDETYAEGTYWGSWRTDEELATDLTILSTGLFDVLNDDGVMFGVTIVYNVQRSAGLTKLICETTCTDQSSLDENYISCAVNALGSGYNGFHDLLHDIGEKFNEGTSYSVACSVLQSVRVCAEDYYKGCAVLERKYELEREVGAYGVVDLCNATLSFDTHQWAGICDSAEFVESETPYAENRCFPAELTSHLTGDSALEDAEICRAFKEQVRCYLQNAKCCSTRINVVGPKRHTWAMINSLYEETCDIMMKKQNSNSNTDYAAVSYIIRPLGPDCDYMDVWDCYQPLLDVVNLQSSDLTSIDRSELTSILNIREVIKSDTSKCPSQDDFVVMKQCTKSFIERCKFPKLCREDKEEETMPFADIFYEDVSQLCSQSCESTPDLDKQGLICNYESLEVWSLDVIANEMLNKYSAADCSKLSDFSDCFIKPMGDCDPKIREFFNDKVGLETLIYDAAQRCEVSLGQFQFTSTSAQANSADYLVPGFIETTCALMVWSLTVMLSLSFQGCMEP